MTGRSVRVLAGTVAAAAVVLVACGVPAEDTPRRVGADDVPPELTRTTTTTSTTVPTSTAPTTSAATTTSAVPSSLLPVEPVALYYLRGTELVPVVRELPAPASPGATMAALGDFPQPGDPEGLRSVLPRDSVLGVSVNRGQATVDLAPGVIERLLPGDPVYLWAQMVLSLTGRPGIGQVAVTVGGVPFTIQRGDGSAADVVFREDYEFLLEGAPPTTTTTTVATTLPLPAVTAATG